MGFSMDVGSSCSDRVFTGAFKLFFSPCVLPLVPLYLGYLSGGAEQGELYGKRGRLFVNTICFVIGISSAFFMMGLGVSAAGSFLNKNQAMVSRIGGILVILFGLYQLGIFGKSKLLGTEHRFWLKLDKLKMSPVVALVFGFTFSFAWTPCVGPALASVLLMAGSAGTKLTGFLLIGVYTLGFILPFLAVGLFTAKVLRDFSKSTICCQVYGEDRRNPDDLYGTSDVYRQDERDHRIFIGNSRNTDFIKRDNEKGIKEKSRIRTRPQILCCRISMERSTVWQTIRERQSFEFLGNLVWSVQK